MRKILLFTVIIMLMSLLLVSGCDLLGGAEEDPVPEEEEASVDHDNPERVVHAIRARAREPRFG